MEEEDSVATSDVHGLRQSLLERHRALHEETPLKAGVQLAFAGSATGSTTASARSSPVPDICSIDGSSLVTAVSGGALEEKELPVVGGSSLRDASEICKSAAGLEQGLRGGEILACDSISASNHASRSAWASALSTGISEEAVDKDAETSTASVGDQPSRHFLEALQRVAGHRSQRRAAQNRWAQATATEACAASEPSVPSSKSELSRVIAPAPPPGPPPRGKARPRSAAGVLGGKPIEAVGTLHSVPAAPEAASSSSHEDSTQPAAATPAFLDPSIKRSHFLQAVQLMRSGEKSSVALPPRPQSATARLTGSRDCHSDAFSTAATDGRS